MEIQEKKWLCPVLCHESRVSLKQNPGRKKYSSSVFRLIEKQKILYAVTINISLNSQIKFFISFRNYHLKDYGWRSIQELITQLSMLWCNLVMLKYLIYNISSIDIACHTSFVILNISFLQH